MTGANQHVAGRGVAVKGTVDSYARERAKDIQNGACQGTASMRTRCRDRGTVRNEASGSAGATPGRSFSVPLGVWASACRQCRATEGF